VVTGTHKHGEISLHC
jgi:hypothetical protein